MAFFFTIINLCLSLTHFAYAQSVAIDIDRNPSTPANRNAALCGDGKYYGRDEVPSAPKWLPGLSFTEVGNVNGKYVERFVDPGTIYFEMGPDSANRLTRIEKLHVVLDRVDPNGNLYHCEFDEITLDELNSNSGYVVNRAPPLGTPVITLKGLNANEAGGSLRMEVLKHALNPFDRYNDKLVFEVTVTKQILDENHFDRYDAGTIDGGIFDAGILESELLPTRIQATRNKINFNRLGILRHEFGVKKIIFCNDNCRTNPIEGLDFIL